MEALGEAVLRWAAFASIGCAFLLAGCGTPGAPQPPSLKLPDRVTDLTAVRTGSTVTLHWTTPKKTTDHLLIKGPVEVAVCRREGAGNCEAAGKTSSTAGAAGEFHETLPAALTSGKPRQLDYFIELKSPHGRSAGLSTAATVLAGTAPPSITGLAAEVRADGVALRWNGSEATSGSKATSVRLHRKLLTPPEPKQKPKNSLEKPAAEPVMRDLLVEAPGPGQQSGAIDHTAHFGEVYEYTAQRIERVAIDGHDAHKTLELAGEVSTPVRIDVIDTFPPSIPQGLVAVLVPEEKTIDLSWQPDSDPYTDSDLAGYIVYRAEGDGSWQRISGAQPLTGSAYRDAAVEAGHTYRYAVTAIDLTGHESKRSAEASESVPNH